MTSGPASESRIERALRRAVVAILVLVLVGTEAEMFLVKHYEEPWQLVPVVLIGLTLIVLAWHALSRGSAALRSFRVLMALALVSGAAGMVQHYRVNVVDTGESDPSLSGRALYIQAVAGSIPTFAPGTMVQIGLLGLAFAYRHPRLRDEPPRRTTE